MCEGKPDEADTSRAEQLTVLEEKLRDSERKVHELESQLSITQDELAAAQELLDSSTKVGFNIMSAFQCS